MEEAETMNVTFGFIEVMELLKALLSSSTPLSDVIFNNTPKVSSTKRKYEEVASSIPNSNVMNLKVMVQRSTKKLLYAEAEEDFVEFLFSLLIIPLGGVHSLLSCNSLIKGMDSLYRSAADLIHDKYFKCLDAKNRLIKPKIPHGYISTNHIFPLTEECLSSVYIQMTSLLLSTKFPRSKGSYLKGPLTYKVTDDLTVTPFCIVSVLSSLSDQKIPVSDVEEVQLQIGLKEALSILKASLTSTSALSDALLNRIMIKQPKREV